MHITGQQLTRVQDITVLEFLTADACTLHFILGSEAMERKLMLVTEESRQGSVNTLQVSNKSEFYIFMSDGDILEGAKQNRVLNTSVFLAPFSTYKLPVSCVEQGRWNYESEQFRHSEVSAPSTLRARKAASVRASAAMGKKGEANQIEVWDTVHEYSSRMQINSDTSDLTHLLKTGRKTQGPGSFFFTPGKEFNGFMLFRDGRAVSADIFNTCQAYSHYAPRVLEGVLFDPVRSRGRKRKPLRDDEMEQELALFMEQRLQAEKLEIPTQGAGDLLSYNAASFECIELTYGPKRVHTMAYLRQAGRDTGRTILDRIVL